MTKSEALKILKNTYGIEKVLEQYSTPKFYEFVCLIYGDVVNFRVYKNGMITER